MKVFWVELPPRTVGMSWDPPDPGEYCQPCGFYVAETRGRAKLLLVRDWMERPFYGASIEHEDFLSARTKLLLRDVDWPEGEAPDVPAGPWDDADGTRAPEPWESLWKAYEAKFPVAA